MVPVLDVPGLGVQMYKLFFAAFSLYAAGMPAMEDVRPAFMDKIVVAYHQDVNRFVRQNVKVVAFFRDGYTWPWQKQLIRALGGQQNRRASLRERRNVKRYARDLFLYGKLGDPSR